MRSTHAATVGLGALAVLLLVAFGAVAAQARVGESTQATTVTLAGWASSPEETAALGRTIASFERLNRSIDVEYTPISGDYDAFMLSRFAARRPPDVFYVDSLDIPDYLPALEPLNRYVQRTRNWSTKPFYQRLLSGFTVNGRIYGFPKDWSPLGLIGNTQMLQRAGVSTPPATWAQFTQALQRIRSSGAVSDGAPACLSPRLGSHPRVHLPGRRRLAERRQDPGGDRLAEEPGDGQHVPRLAPERPRADAGAARRRLVR